jgi:hypothetical protein
MMSPMRKIMKVEMALIKIITTLFRAKIMDQKITEMDNRSHLTSI